MTHRVLFVSPLIACGLLAATLHGQEAVVTLVGVVLPSDARPGEPVSGSMVKDPKRFAGIPGLQVVEMQVPLKRGDDGEASFEGVVVDLGDGRHQRAQDGLTVKIAEGASRIPIIVRIAERPQFVVERDITIKPEKAIQKQVTTGTPRDYKTSPVCLDGGVQVIHGPLSGDSNVTTIEVSGHRAQIVAETPRAVYWQLPTSTLTGTQWVVLYDGARTAAFRAAVARLDMSADRAHLLTGESTPFHAVVRGPEGLPESAWRAGVVPDLLDSSKIGAIAPGFRLPKPGEAGVFLLTIENASPGVIKIQGTTNEIIVRELRRTEFAGIPYVYTGLIVSQVSGNFAVNGTLTPFFEEVGAETATIQVRQAEARQAGMRGDWSKACALHREAVALARQETNKEALADASLKYARVCELSAAQDATGTASLDKAANTYREVTAIGTAPQKLLAQNNLGILLLRQGKAKEALQVLQEMSYLKVASSEGYVYAYNTARALEQTGDPTAAFKLYAEALQTQPAFEPAIDGAFRVLWKSAPQGLSDATYLAQQLIDRGEAERVTPRLRESLKVWGADPQLQRLLAQLVRCYAELSLDPAAFDKTEWPAMVPLIEGPSGRAVREIRLAFAGPLEAAFYDRYELGPVRAWREEPWKAQPYSLLLRRLGDGYRRHGRFDDALARYALAWSLNPEDVEAALYAADLLQEEPKILDPENRLLNQFIEKLFESKAKAYLGNDWLNILRLHTVLGTIYVRQEKWGTPNSPRGALFQFEHALRAEKEYRAKNPKFPESPGLHAQLANVYLHLNRRGDAGEQYLAATEVYMKEGHGKEAREMLDRVRPIGSDLSPALLQMFSALETQVQVLCTGARCIT